MSVIFQVFIKMRVIAGLLTEFLGKIREIQAIFIRDTFCAEISIY